MAHMKPHIATVYQMIATLNYTSLMLYCVCKHLKETLTSTLYDVFQLQKYF